jgi:hypothetical protein
MSQKSAKGGGSGAKTAPKGKKAAAPGKKTNRIEDDFFPDTSRLIRDQIQPFHLGNTTSKSSQAIPKTSIKVSLNSRRGTVANISHSVFYL